jgi:CubicO group peptidase (beta-lactamase class C family)
MRRGALAVIGTFGLLLLCGAGGRPAEEDGRGAGGAVPDSPWLRRELERVRAKYELPALAASLVVGDKVVAASAVGHRKLGDPARVTQADRFQVASVSKPMTSTLIGALVEAGVLSFDDTLEKMFPELAEEMQPDYRKATVRMLLAHTAGLPGVPRKVESRKPTTDRKQAMANRYQYVRNALADPPLARHQEHLQRLVRHRGQLRRAAAGQDLRRADGVTK